MDSLVLDFDQDGSRLALSGDIDTLLRNRRVSIFLRDYLGDTREHGGLLSMPIGQEQLGPLVKRIEDALGRHGLQCNRSSRLSNSIGAFLQAEQAFAEFSKRAYEIWNNEIPPPEFSTFVEVLCESLPGRTLYPLQLLAAYHLAFAQNAANFSVPGAGKTSVVYGAFAFLRSLQAASEKHVNKLLVVGPLSSFGPWESEFAECFGSPPRSRRLFGGVPKEERKRILYSELPSYKELELVLTSYQSVPGDLEYLQHFHN